MTKAEGDYSSVDQENTEASAPLEHEQQAVTLDSVLGYGSFDGYFVIFDYMTFKDEDFVRLMRGVGDVLNRVEKDEEIKTLTEKVGDSGHFLVSLRKREIALEVLLPLIEQIGELSFPEYPEDNNPQNDQRRKINLVYTAMYLATGNGTKGWPVDALELFPMEGKERTELIKGFFEKDKLRNITVFERQIGNLTFETYKANKGEMDKTLYEVAQAYQPTADEILDAEKFIADALFRLSRGREKANEKLSIAAAKIRHADPEKASASNVLLAESMIFVGRP
jgi:hypothetical protein